MAIDLTFRFKRDFIPGIHINQDLNDKYYREEFEINDFHSFTCMCILDRSNNPSNLLSEAIRVGHLFESSYLDYAVKNYIDEDQVIDKKFLLNGYGEPISTMQLEVCYVERRKSVDGHMSKFIKSLFSGSK